MAKPHYDLTNVRALAAQASIGQRVQVRAAEGYPCSAPTVERFIRQTVGSLSLDAFVRSELQVYQTFSVQADIYAFTDPSKNGWYIKFYVSGGRLVIVSFHLCADDGGDLVRADGKVVRARKK